MPTLLRRGQLNASLHIRNSTRTIGRELENRVNVPCKTKHLTGLQLNVGGAVAPGGNYFFKLCTVIFNNFDIVEVLKCL